MRTYRPFSLVLAVLFQLAWTTAALADPIWGWHFNDEQIQTKHNIKDDPIVLWATFFVDTASPEGITLGEIESMLGGALTYNGSVWKASLGSPETGDIRAPLAADSFRLLLPGDEFEFVFGFLLPRDKKLTGGEYFLHGELFQGSEVEFDSLKIEVQHGNP
jgi:hypothetical protein